ncbi:bifunctional DNA primase/polymerase [Streptomyces sp. CB01881]|uniref:bifunctional DNA primase/polymerase n=1 Tax=Streptomyces sp. CB01881 TaxID=2078691 RepID=UPI000CDC64FA|nr:bifunctional DNA primase/polymerase [Streptomyces sp. CB01881]AUY50988.1 DNA primase [Streptomyces sp. CB01881]TYC74373.1 DNA primase [Streptomyces sp. CB01881]
MTGNPLLAAALTAAERGWRVFPLLPGSKKPALHSSARCPRTAACTTGHQGWEQRATCDPAVIWRTWSHGPYGIGLATGPSHLVVVDLDTPKPGTPLPVGPAGPRDGAGVLAALCERYGRAYPSGTYTVRTPSGGTHLYFAAPAGSGLRNTAGERGTGLGRWIDTRAGGGYVVAAGSTVAGHRYEAVLDTGPVPLPAWLHTLLAPPPRPATPVVPLSSRAGRRPGYADAALRNESANVANAAEGNRNWTLTRAARALGRFVADGRLSRGEVEDALKGAAEQAGLPARDAAATITSALDWSIAHNPAGDAA